MPRESLAKKRERAGHIIGLLHSRYPQARTALKHETVHQLLVATILSAQCTDERVNMVTPGLFKKYRSVRAFAEADLDELAADIRSTGFFNSKARAIKQSAQSLLKEFGGTMPRTIEQLTRLRGVGRKTASVVLGNAFGIAEGVVVDTHVTRISRLLGLTTQRDPVKIEQDLMKLVPQDEWIDCSHMIILHGRATCKARKPDCANCPLSELCPSSRA